jgi:hypothetical protein
MFYYNKSGITCGNPDLTTDIIEFIEGQNLNIYPNPVNSELTVELSPGEVKSIEIFDLTGKSLYFIQPNIGRIKIDVGSLNPGLYILRLRLQNSSVQTKLIKL